MKHQVLFSLKNNEKLLMNVSAAVVIGTLRVNKVYYTKNYCFARREMMVKALQ